MKKVFYFVALLLLTLSVRAQNDGKEKSFGINFSGFVKNDIFYDTRQTISIREGHFLLYPAKFEADKNGDDINASPGFNILAIQTRLTGKITGPDAFGAKTSGMIEGAFFGHTDADINGFRLRHAFVKLNWEQTELLFGQFWHPMFNTACFPEVISFNTGVPFQPFSRNPQIRMTYSLGNLKFSATALSQRDFASPDVTNAAGKVIYTGSQTLRNSYIPEFQGQLFFNKKDAESGKEILAGMGGGYKTLVPRLVTDSNYIANESVGSYNTEAYFKISVPAITIKLLGTYGQNTYDVTGIGSYAVTRVSDSMTNQREYAPLNTVAGWLEIMTNGTKIQAGLFAGYTKNLGAGKNVTSTYFGTRSKVDYVYRISPRVIYKSGKTQFALELEYTTAAHGDFGPQGEVINSKEVSNVRVLFGTYYFF